jgi:hypothetical protein
MIHRFLCSIALALAVTAAITVPAAAQDLRSPDAADTVGQPAVVADVDLRSPDAADPDRRSAVVADVDLRSPDAADPYSGVPVQVIEAAPVVSVHKVDRGFDWRDAGLGAGALLSFALLIMGGSVFVKRHGPALS